MSFKIKKTSKPETTAKFITASILNQLKIGKNVLFFVAGGSAISVGIKVAELLRGHLHNNLKVTLTDERYGHINHPDSNYFQLIKNGFVLPYSKIIPVLIDKDKKTTTKNFNKIIKHEFATADYKIGLFGIGEDGHTAGILPGSIAVDDKNFVCNYDTPKFSRITLTCYAIEKLDEAVVWMQNKPNVLENLQKEISIREQPSQVLKKVPLLTIFTNK